MKALIVPLLAACLLGTACSDREESATGRNVRWAAEYYAMAKESIAEEELEEARAYLRNCLYYDESHGGAHNDLGVMAMREDRLYDAAQHFELARMFLPGDPRPRRNLAVVLERGGKITEALSACRAALEVQPDHVPSLQTMAWIQLRHQRPDETTPELLTAIIQRGETETWRTWAREQQFRLQGGKR